MARSSTSPATGGEDSDSDTSSMALREPPPKRYKRGSTSTRSLPREIGVMRNAAEQGSATFVGSASGIHFIRTVYSAVARISAAGRVEGLTPENDLVPGEDDHLHKGPTGAQIDSRALWQKNEVDEDADDDAVSFAFDDLIGWTQSYFDNWHPPFPYLHAPSVLKAFDKISQSGFNSVEYLEQITIRSMISIGLADKRQMRQQPTKPVPRILAFKSFEEALSSLQPVLCKPTSLPAIRAAVSVQLFLASLLRLNAASRLGGLIVRMAFHLGLHRCPARFSSFSHEEMQLRRRLFWSIYCLERFLCQSLGLPLAIRDDDVDVCYPDHEQHRQNSEADTDQGIKTPSVEEPDGRLRLLTFLAKHAKLKGMILELRNKSVLHSQEDSDRAVFIHASLSKWWNEVEDSVDFISGIDESQSEAQSKSQHHHQKGTQSLVLRPLHRLILAVSKHESIISLNRPVMALPKKSSGYAAALQTCIGSSKAIISALRRYMVLEGPENSSNVPGSHTSEGATALLWPSFTWAVWMSVFVIMYATSDGQFPKQLALKNTDLSLEILKHLSLRGSVWPNACGTAIRDLRHAIFKPLVGQALKGGDMSPPKRVVRRRGSQQTRQSQGETTSEELPTAARNDKASELTKTSTLAPMSLGRPQLCQSTSPSTLSARDACHESSSYDLPRGNTVAEGQGWPFPPEYMDPPKAAQGDANYTTPSLDAYASSTNMPPADQMDRQSVAFEHLNPTAHSNNPWGSDVTNLHSRFASFNTSGLMDDPFGLFDIPFWVGQDECSYLTGDGL